MTQQEEEEKNKTPSAGPLSSTQRDSCLLFMNTTRLEGEADSVNNNNNNNTL